MMIRYKLIAYIANEGAACSKIDPDPEPWKEIVNDSDPTRSTRETSKA